MPLCDSRFMGFSKIKLGAYCNFNGSEFQWIQGERRWGKGLCRQGKGGEMEGEVRAEGWWEEDEEEKEGESRGEGPKVIQEI